MYVGAQLLLLIGGGGLTKGRSCDTFMFLLLFRDARYASKGKTENEGT